MESNEEYLLRALLRTSNGLTDSLIPAHGAKLTRLLEKFESAEAVTSEVQTLMHVQGFGKCALAMEWLLERTKRSSDYFSPEQFESDILLLNEKLFEAFLNQPFDMPDFSRSFEAPIRPIQDIQVSADEFLGTSYPSATVFPQTESEQHPAEHEAALPFAEPTWDTTSLSSSIDETPALSAEAKQPAEVPVVPMDEIPEWPPQPDAADPFESALIASSAAQSSGTSDELSPATESSPSLRESMSNDLFEATERVAQTAVEFIDKLTGERTVAMAVFRVTVRAAAESAKSSSNLIAQDFFDAVLKLISFSDEQGKIKTDSFAHIIRDVGDRLTNALAQPSGGITLLKNLTLYIKDPKELFAKG